jgi:hypothetical protein
MPNPAPSTSATATERPGSRAAKPGRRMEVEDQDGRFDRHAHPGTIWSRSNMSHRATHRARFLRGGKSLAGYYVSPWYRLRSDYDTGPDSGVAARTGKHKTKERKRSAKPLSVRPKRFACVECGKRFRTIHAVNDHRRVKHAEGGPQRLRPAPVNHARS